MKTFLIILAVASLLGFDSRSEETLFRDSFKDKLGQGWSWLREHREAWRVSERGLEVRIEPGNMWGPQNDAKNVLLRDAPERKGEIEVTATVENHPVAQYEQVDLVWYYNDSHMVKLGLELVDGQLSIVMGREEKDRTRTVKIVPVKDTTVQLMLLVKGNQIYGRFRAPAANDWQEVGDCDLPELADKPPKLSLQFYQGPTGVEHWARVTDFRVTRR
jgi:regulation of enolase protein 1 (concanavalin A-like superfamily)